MSEPAEHAEHDDQADELEHGDVAEPAQVEGHAPAPIRLGERVTALGMTGTGKSEALLNLFAAHRGQRLLIDVQDHYTLGPVALEEDPPPLEIDNPRAIDWQHRTIRYVPKRIGDRGEMERLHAAIFRRGNLLVVCDEAEDVAPSAGGGAGPFVKRCIKQGRKYRITYTAATQRPVGVDRSVTNQANHLFVFQMTDRDDLKVIAGRLGMTVDELSHTLNQLGEHEYLRHTLGEIDEHGRPIVLAMPALPPETIAFTRRHIVNPEQRPR